VNLWTEDKWTGWLRLYNLTFIVGLAISLLVFWVFNVLFPVPGTDLDGPFVLQGVDGGCYGCERSSESAIAFEAGNEELPAAAKGKTAKEKGAEVSVV
jgi:NCS1 family nucleobase:cation symporter-1